MGNSRSQAFRGEWHISCKKLIPKKKNQQALEGLLSSEIENFITNHVNPSGPFAFMTQFPKGCNVDVTEETVHISFNYCTFNSQIIFFVCTTFWKMNYTFDIEFVLHDDLLILHVCTDIQYRYNKVFYWITPWQTVQYKKIAR